jgi:hypothetical protein
MLLQKDYVQKFLVDNFERIENARRLQGFSWNPIIKEILAAYPVMLADPKLVLDPNNEAHRDRVRNNFLNLRKRKATAYTRVTEPPKELILISPDKPTRIYTDVEPQPFKFLDTYNKPKSAPTNEQEEFQLWKSERDRLKNQQGMHIVIGCVHMPATDKPFFNAFLRFLEDVKPDLKGLHLIGDILDCKALSQHDNGQVSEGTLEEEYNDSNLLLDEIDKRLRPGVEKNYIWGNHEQRYLNILKKVDIAKFGGALMSPTKGCRFIERGYTVQEDYKNGKIQLGHYLDLIHGDYITQNPSKKHLDVYKKSIMFAHTHKMGAHYDGDKAAFNIGWMGDKDHSAFNYAGRITKSQWQNGFAVVHVDAEGFYHVQLVQYYNNQFIFGNKAYYGH